MFPDYTSVSVFDEEVISRFWSRVNKDDSAKGCWVWTGFTNPKGYAQIRYKGTLYLVNRFSWMMAYGDIAEGQMVCHHCDNPPCVRPDHLFLGTNSDNVLDSYRKGRKDRTLGHRFQKGDASVGVLFVKGNTIGIETRFTKENHPVGVPFKKKA